jgi:hypothetical protein
MANAEKDIAKGKPIYVGLDVHKREWRVTVLCQGEELYHAAVVPGASPASRYNALIKV